MLPLHHRSRGLTYLTSYGQPGLGAHFDVGGWGLPYLIDVQWLSLVKVVQLGLGSGLCPDTLVCLLVIVVLVIVYCL